MALSVQRRVWSMLSAATAPGLSNVALAFAPMPVSMRPPNAYVSVVRIQPAVLSLAPITEKPATFGLDFTIACASDSTWAQVVGGLLGLRPAALKSWRLYCSA